MKRSLPVFLLLLVLVSMMLAQTRGDKPLPQPYAEITIHDTSDKDAPAICDGTGFAYTKPQPGNETMSWVEPTNLSVRNVSKQPIERFILSSTWTNNTGDSSEIIWELFTPGMVTQPGSERAVGKARHIPGPRPTLSNSEYNSKEKVEPSIDCHVIAVFFADGTGWPKDAVWPVHDDDEKK